VAKHDLDYIANLSRTAIHCLEGIGPGTHEFRVANVIKTIELILSEATKP